MKLYHHNATAVLFEKATSIRNLPDSWRSIHLKFSKMQERYSHTLRTHFILKGIETALGTDEAYVYLCGDGDVFILFQGRAKPLLGRLAKIFGDLNPSTVRQETASPLIVYDLSKDWAEFYEVCFSKSMNEAYQRMFAKTPPAYQRAGEEAPAP